MMTRAIFRYALSALVISAAGCGGGGGGGGEGAGFRVFRVEPETSNDLNGGDRVTVFGDGFNRFIVARVLFGGLSGFNVQRIDDGEIQVTTPPAPNGMAGPVNVEVEVIDDDGNTKTQGIFGGYTYVGVSGPPAPDTITPTSYTPTGAQSFNISGASLGEGGGTVQVTFGQAGTVQGDVSQAATLVVGNAPVTPAEPPTGAQTVTVESDGGSADVPTTVQYNWSAPGFVSAAHQTAGGASEPVLLGPDLAVMCTAGADAGWGTSDDEILILQGPPPVSVTAVRRQIANTPVGFLDPAASIPVVLNADTFVVYSPGANTTHVSGDEALVVVSSATTTPTVTFQAAPFMAPAPVGRISGGRIAFCNAGADTTLGNSNDDMRILGISGSTITTVATVNNVGGVDATVGAGNVSIPFTNDSDTVFLLAINNGTFGDLDDSLFAFGITSGTSLSTLAAFAKASPVATDAATVVAVVGGQAVVPNTFRDHLAVYRVAGGSFTTTFQDLGTTFDTLNSMALRPFVRAGTNGVALVGVGTDQIGNTADDVVRIFDDPVAGTFNDLTVQGTALVTTLGSGRLVVFTPGADLTPGTAGDRAILVEGDGSTARDFTAIPLWNQAFAPATDTNRVFAIGAGAGGYGDGDETLVVHQSLAVSESVNSTLLPLAIDGTTPLTGTERFIPIGFDWGLAQTPGGNGAFGDPDDGLVAARY